MTRRAIVGLALLLGAGLPSAGAAEEPAPEKSVEAVILLHGLGRTSRSMRAMSEALETRGYRVTSFDYPSGTESVDRLARRLDGLLETCCKRAPVARIHFVTHSLGGIVVRYYLATSALPRLGRVVMISPPNAGSELVDALESIGLDRATGPSGARLGTDPQSLPNTLPPVDFELGVITGDVSLNPFFSWLIPGDDDGKVSVESAKTDGMSDFLVVPHSHTFIMASDVVIEQTGAFLRDGAFRREVGDEEDDETAPALPAELRPVWSWSEPGVELHDPAFSSDATEIALTRKLHWPSGDEARGLSEAELAAYAERQEKTARFADPEIVLLRVGESEAERIDWGWQPGFSPDGRYLVYAHQRRPLSGPELPASELAGNELRIYSREKGTAQAVARPESGWLAAPVYSPDGSRISFFYADAVDGERGGYVGVGRFGCGTGEVKAAYAPSLVDGGFELLPRKLWVGRHLFAQRMRPTGSAPGVYEVELLALDDIVLDDPDVVYRWGERGPGDPPAPIGVGPYGSLQVYDGGWKQLDDADTPSDGYDARDEAGTGVPSPDGELFVHVDGDLVVLRPGPLENWRAPWRADGRVGQVVWSADSARLAVVVSRHLDAQRTRFESDELVVLDLVW